jgi:hypothetical protein
MKTVVLAALTEADRAFLLSFENGEPDWTLFPSDSLPRLPAPQWKLHNIRYLRNTDSERHAKGVVALQAALTTF